MSVHDYNHNMDMIQDPYGPSRDDLDRQLRLVREGICTHKNSLSLSQDDIDWIEKEILRTKPPSSPVTMVMVEAAFDDAEPRLVLSPAERRKLSFIRRAEETAELRETVASLKTQLDSARAEITRLHCSRIRDKPTMLAEIRSGVLRVWVGQLHNGEFWKQTEIGDDHACGHRISTEEAAVFCLAAKQPDEPNRPTSATTPAAKPADPRGEAMARAFARDGLLDAFGRPRQG